MFCWHFKFLILPLFFICDKMCVYQCDKGGTLNTCEERLREKLWTKYLVEYNWVWAATDTWNYKFLRSPSSFICVMLNIREFVYILICSSDDNRLCSNHALLNYYFECKEILNQIFDQPFILINALILSLQLVPTFPVQEHI